MGVISNLVATPSGTVDTNAFAGTTIGQGITGMSFDDYEMKNKIDQSYLAIDAAKKKAADDKRKQAELQFSLAQNEMKRQKEVLMSGGNLTPEQIQNLKDLDTGMKQKFSDLSKDQIEIFSQQSFATPDTAKQSASVPVTPTDTTPTPTAGGSNGGGTPGASIPEEKNPANIYDMNRGKIYDSTAIPKVLQGGRITPGAYFTRNGMNWMKDSKRIAVEMGMTDYRGTPGQNYALINYLEEKKSGNGTPSGTGGSDSGRKFDGVNMEGDNIPNRFTEEDRQTVMAMAPDEQKKYISQRNLEDLRKMLPGNVALINKVFGTNYTSDDLTGGIGRQTIMGTGMTQAGLDVQRRIDKLTIGQAQKFMSKGAELDNSETDNMIIDDGNQTVQTGRRKLLEEIVDGTRQPGGFSMDEQDEAYMNEYKQYKAEKLVADDYNSKITEWNSIDGAKDPMRKNLLLKQIQNDVNHTMKTNPTVYASLKAELDRIPEFAKNGKIPTINQKASPGESTAEKGTVKPAGTSSPPPAGGVNIDITPPSNNNIPPAGTTPGSTPSGGAPTVNNEGNGGQAIPVAKSSPQVTPKSSGGGYNNDQPEARYGYSSNSISKG